MASIVRIRGNANSIMDIVRDLRAKGMTQGVDFDFAFKRALWTDVIEPVPSHAVFTLYSEKQGTFFSLQYSDLLL
jgi:hypothetical protein